MEAKPKWSWIVKTLFCVCLFYFLFGSGDCEPRTYQSCSSAFFHKFYIDSYENKSLYGEARLEIQRAEQAPQ